MFDIPEKTPDGLSEFPPGLYQIAVRVPNDISYTYPDGEQPLDFTSNIAYLKVLPMENLAYRIWSDQGHCYDDTNGEVGSDEIYAKAYTSVFDSALNAPQVFPTTSVKWNGADAGNTQYWNWEIFGQPGNPQKINGVLAIGILGWEVDSEDALNEAITSYDAAFTKFWNIVWTWIDSNSEIVAAVINGLFANVAWWIALIVVVAVLLVTLIVGLIWAAWAPPDRIILDLITLTETQFYYLTYPLAALPVSSVNSLIPDIIVSAIPESKYSYLFTEERQYKCNSEDSRYGFRFLYQRDV